MLPLKTSYGRPVSKDCAQRLYKNFFKIKRRSIDKIRANLPEDAEATRFHAGGLAADGTCNFLDMAFIFDADVIREILDKKEKKPKPDGVIIFFGARDQSDSVVNTKIIGGKTVNESNDVDGRPTLLMFPFSVSNDSVADGGSMDVDLDNGREHPGTGGGGTTDKTSVVNLTGQHPMPIPDELPTQISFKNIRPLL